MPSGLEVIANGVLRLGSVKAMAVPAVVMRPIELMPVNQSFAGFAIHREG